MNITLNQFKLQYITSPSTGCDSFSGFFSFLALLLKSSNDYYLPSVYDHELKHDISSATFIGWIPLDSFRWRRKISHNIFTRWIEICFYPVRVGK